MHTTTAPRLYQCACTAAGVLMVLLASVMPAVGAVVFDVDSTTDAHDANPGDGTCATTIGECTLRAAAEEASFVTGAVTIQVPTGTFVISSAPVSLTCQDFGCGLLSVKGSTMGVSVLDGNGAGTLLAIDLRPVSIDDVTLQNALVGASVQYTTLAADHLTVTDTGTPLTLTSGGSSSVSNCTIRDNANGIYGHYVDLTVSNCTIDGNGERGIQVDPGTIILTDSSVTHHTGAGVFCYGEGRIEGSTISENDVGINCDTVDVHPTIEGLVVHDSTVTKNTHDGILSRDSRLTATETTIADNGGCGITVGGEGGYTTIVDTELTRNGCGVVFATGPESYIATITRSTISDNAGPGIKALSTANFSSHSTLSVVDTEVVGNHDGGLRYETGSSTDAVIDVSGSLIASNESANHGGGVAVLNPGAATHRHPVLRFTNSTLSGNQTDGSGGALYNEIDEAVIALNNVSVIENVANADAGVNGAGGAISNLIGAEVKLQNTLFAGNLNGQTSSLCEGVVTQAAYTVSDRQFDCTLTTPGSGNVVQPNLAFGPLSDHGGPTRTHALLVGSPAIDAGNPSGCRDDLGAAISADQRGVARPQFARCDVGAYEFACGNSTVDLGETCDDGNALAGDCCSEECRLEPAGGPCSDDDACTGAGTCDASGVCSPGAPVECGACATCDSGAGCVASVMTGCHQPTRRFSGQLFLSAGSTPKLTWRWTAGGATTLGDFGGPLSGDRYALCVFDESGARPQVAFGASTRSGSCHGRPCWRKTGATSFTYVDREKTPDGLAGLLLKSGADGKSKVLVSGRGPALALPGLPLALPARVQLQAPNGQCWEAQYSEVGVSRNDGGQFKAKAFQP